MSASRASLRLGLPLGLSMLGVALVGAGACSTGSNGDDAGPDVDTRPPTPPEWDRPVTRPDDTQATQDRAACTFGRGALAGETLGTSTPIEGDLPIDTIVVLVMENHSFDSYFAKLGEYTNRSDIEVEPPDASNPRVLPAPSADAGADAGDAAPPELVPVQHAPHECTLDTAHAWSKSHMEWDQGKMDGFVQANEDGPPLGDGARSLFYWDQTDLPFYYELANTFAIADHYHCAVLGPTWPNRMYTYAATSFGRTTNDLPDISGYPFPDNDATILDELEKRHVDWGLYGTSGALTIYATNVLTRWGRKVVHFDSDFFADAKAGTLPHVVYLDTDVESTPAINPDEHPPADVQIGQKWVSDVVHALMTSPQWGRTALFFTYDEHGGYYDHVPPPPACAPDTTAPILKNGDTTPDGFDRDGIRVPFIVVSPYAKKAFVSHKTYDHTSIVRFIEAKFRVPALTARDANADIPTDMFDFQNPPFATPPTLADPSVNPAEQSYCETTYPN